MWIKICGVGTARAALAACEAGADAIGFIFVPTARRYIEPERVQFLAPALPAGVERVGVFVDVPPAEAARTARLAGLTLLQLHGDEPPEYLDELPLPAIKALKLSGPDDLAQLDRYHRAAAILLEPKVAGQHGGAGVALDWSLARQARDRLKQSGYPGRVILAGGLNPENVRAAAVAVQPDGVDVSSGVETDGTKDLDRIYAFVRNARGSRQ